MYILPLLLVRTTLCVCVSVARVEIRLVDPGYRSR
jgi:hypothetical protein